MNEQNNNVNNTNNTNVNQINSMTNSTTAINNNINNSPAEILTTIPQTLTTKAPEPQIATVQTTSTPPNNQTNTPKEEPPKKGGNFKYVLAFIFLVGIVAFVFFLPEVTTYVESKKKGDNYSATSQIENGTLTCTLDKTSDETDTTYEIDYTFNNKKLLTTNIITTIESTNATYLNKRKQECDNALQISANIPGVRIDSSLSVGILTINEMFTHKNIDNNRLTQYVEAGGTYPEFKYGKNVYDIQTNMVKKGYDCTVSSSIR